MDSIPTFGDQFNKKKGLYNDYENAINSSIFQKTGKDEGEITAMTGDGVNDASALKKAYIGIAMGERGTQIAQDVADMILKDDSFLSIVDAIEEGRIIFGNIRKFIVYQLSYHLAEILIIAGISFSLFYLPLLPSQLLHVFNMRDPDENIFVNQVVKNKYIWMALGICIVIQTIKGIFKI